MGYMRHHGMLITGFGGHSVGCAHEAATRIFSDSRHMVTPVSAEGVNGCRSFAVLPDGSKEGWPHSDDGDGARAEFKEWLRAARKENTHLDWAEVQYGDDFFHTAIVAHSDEDKED